MKRCSKNSYEAFKYKANEHGFQVEDIIGVSGCRLGMKVGKTFRNLRQASMFLTRITKKGDEG
jgi:hypothetical protein